MHAHPLWLDTESDNNVPGCLFECCCNDLFGFVGYIPDFGPLWNSQNNSCASRR
jgi:hypothetical protein